MHVVQSVKSNVCAYSGPPASVKAFQRLMGILGDIRAYEPLYSCQELPRAGSHLLGIARMFYMVQLLLCGYPALSVCSFPPLSTSVKILEAY